MDEIFKILLTSLSLFSSSYSGTKIGLCFIPNTCIGLATNVLTSLELRQEGLTFSNFGRQVSLDDTFHMGYVILILTADIIIYMLLYW